MRKNLAYLSALLLLPACSSNAILEMPPVSESLGNWGQLSTSKFPESSCPKISGQYSEPPVLFQSDRDVSAHLSEGTGSYYGYFPFHLANRKESAVGEISLPNNRFLIEQRDPDNFYVSFTTQKSSIVEYHFQAVEGDFECKSGYIEFPITGHSGMIEGKAVNSQVRNVVFREDDGSLIVQRTIGPYRGDSSTDDKKFRHEFLRYPLYGAYPAKD